MKKTDKKIDNRLRKALTEVCEDALDNVNGFQWLTHNVNFKLFPDSLSVTCVFDTDESLMKANETGGVGYLRQLICNKLESIGIKTADISRLVNFISENDDAIDKAGLLDKHLH